MTIFELEDALTEFFIQNTRDYLLRSNELSDLTTPPKVWSGFIPRNQVGAIIPGDISTYPCIIINSRRGSTEVNGSDSGQDTVQVEVIMGAFDNTLDQQGYRDALNFVQRMRDRLIQISIIRERFPLLHPIKWEVNRFYGGEGTNYFPYFFAEMLLMFALPIMVNQYDVDYATGETTPGMYNEFPIPSGAQPKDEFNNHY